MTAALSAYGRLGQAPRQITTRTGKSMAACTMAVDVAGYDDPPLWLGLIAFGRLADELLRHAKGDLLSASGRLQRNTWTDSDGAAREQLQLVADTIVSARTVRPGGRKRATSETPASDVPDDPVPF